MQTVHIHRPTFRVGSALAILAASAATAAAQSSCGVDALSDWLGGGTAGMYGVPRFETLGSPVVGLPYSIRVANGRPGAAGFYALSFQGGATPVPEFGATLHVVTPFHWFTSFALDGDGRSDELFGAPTVATRFCGLDFHVQAAVFDDTAPGGLAFTSGRHVVVGARAPSIFQGEALPLDASTRWFRPHDFNADGNVDFLALDLSGDRIVVHLGGGDGTIGGSIPSDSIDAPNRCETLDFDGDGLLDVVVANTSAGLVAVHFSNGDGTFSLPSTTAVGTAISEIALGEFDGDGLPDLVLTRAPASNTLAFRGLANGQFSPLANPATADDATDLDLADVDGDGVLDLVTLGFSPNVLTSSIGNGDGTFQAPLSFPVTSTPTRIETADIDGDGHLDVVVGFVIAEWVDVLWGDGSGAFSAARTLTLGRRVGTFDVVDLDGDGDGEVFLTDEASATFSVVESLADRSFAAPIVRLTGPNSGTALVDLDEDGALDLVVNHFGSYSLVRGDGTLHFDAAPVFRTAAGPQIVRTADLDHDDRLDVLVDTTSVSISALYGLGAGDFTPPATFALGATLNGLADFDEDGRVDLLGSESDGALVAFGLGNGGFGPPLLFPAGTTIAYTRTADFDDDGHADIVVFDTSPDVCRVLLGRGDGTFEPFVQTNFAHDPDTTLIGDFDGDGVTDLVITNTPSGPATLQLGVGNGAFVAHPVAVPLPPTNNAGVVVGDVDQDGDLDVVATTSTSSATLLLGNGDGTFVVDSLVVPLAARVVELADVDGDALPDLLFTDPTLQSVYVFPAAGGGTFAPSRRHAAPPGSQFSALADVDGDGLLDFVAVSNVEPELAVLRNRAVR